MKEISAEEKIEVIANAASAKKAQGLIAIDLRKLGSISDHFIIASGESTVQIEAIADNIESELLSHNCRVLHKEGKGEALWILLDCGDIVVHVFYKDTRAFYNLEKLWYDAPQKKLNEKNQ